MIKYKIDIMQKLAECGYSRQKIRDAKILSQATIQNIMDMHKLQTLPEEQIQKDEGLLRRREKGIKHLSLDTLNRICIMCGLKIGDVIEIIPTDNEILKLYKAKI